MKNKIQLYVRTLMKGYRTHDKKLEIEIVLACLDEYEMQLSMGIAEEEAYEKAIADVDQIVKNKGNPENKFKFSFLVCIITFAIALIEIFISLISPQALEVYGIEMLIVSLGFLGLMMYAIVKHKERYWYDYIILAIFAIVWIASLAQIGVFSFHGTMPDRYWSAEYSFPCILKILTYTTEAIDPPIFELASTKFTFSFNFLISLILLIVMSSVLIIKHFKKKGGKLK